jgi:Leucine-rich repeat (LRR) protein
VFDGLDNLQTLMLWGNSLSELSPGVFDGLDNLQELNLESNSLSELSCLTAWTTCKS